ncbi:MAG: hypothetical protein A2776_01185 [Candidatus Levybacteria bacterium RIFCSPHIGHO2_01_FULL_40_10]|nr:MAG: hypothetical protein A2776_01185 [Candidatus Levybacteria bacterium RIFCSPHIGHO2_01_FULL_40_10]
MPDIYNSNTITDSSKDKNRRIIFISAGLFLAIVAMVIGIFLIDKRRSSQLKNIPFITKYVTPSEQSLTFAKKVLKPEYIPGTLNLKKIVHPEQQYVEYRNKAISDEDSFTFQAEEWTNGTELGQYISKDVSNNPNGEEETVVKVLDKYFLLPKDASGRIKKKEYDNGMIGYEIILEQNSSFIDSIIAYAVPDPVNLGAILIRIGACHIKSEAPEYAQHSCLK